ncbi:hypothetical protein [Sulfurimonas indica]|uniref:hypothetical protein n=1 Tax=Sulfurimonas TaxID=202746 RepID=UPI0012650FC0|nr:hypothetical protein [Sulfurimonas indica]
MNFIYDNKTTGNFIEFSCSSIDCSLGEEGAIEAFIDLISNTKDTKDIELPQELLKQLSDEELDLFMLIPYSKDFRESVKNMLYVSKDESFVYDQFGSKYILDYVGVKKSVICLDTVKGLAVFNLPYSLKENSTFSLNDIKEEYY